MVDFSTRADSVDSGGTQLLPSGLTESRIQSTEVSLQGVGADPGRPQALEGRAALSSTGAEVRARPGFRQGEPQDLGPSGPMAPRGGASESPSPAQRTEGVTCSRGPGRPLSREVALPGLTCQNLFLPPTLLSARPPLPRPSAPKELSVVRFELEIDMEP